MPQANIEVLNSERGRSEATFFYNAYLQYKETETIDCPQDVDPESCSNTLETLKSILQYTPESIKQLDNAQAMRLLNAVLTHDVTLASCPNEQCRVTYILPPDSDDAHTCPACGE